MGSDAKAPSVTPSTRTQAPRKEPLPYLSDLGSRHEAQ